MLWIRCTQPTPADIQYAEKRLAESRLDFSHGPASPGSPSSSAYCISVSIIVGGSRQTQDPDLRHPLLLFQRKSLHSYLQSVSCTKTAVLSNCGVWMVPGPPLSPTLADARRSLFFLAVVPTRRLPPTPSRSPLPSLSTRMWRWRHRYSPVRFS